MRVALLCVLLAAPAVWATDPGQASFQRACARCHTAHAVPEGAKVTHRKPEPAKNGAPDLGDVARARTSEQLRAFILAPWDKKPDTGCYTALLDPQEVDDLVAWLQTAARPPLPSREVLLKRNLERSIAEYKQAKAKREEKAKARKKVIRKGSQPPVMLQEVKPKGGTR